MQIFFLFKYIFKHRYKIAAFTAAFVVFSSILLGIPWLLKIIINDLVTSGDKEIPANYTLIILVSIPIFGLSIYWHNYLLNSLNNRMIADLRKDTFNHILDLPLEFFTKHRLGALISRVTSDIMFIQMTLMMATVDLMRQSIFLLGALILMFTLNWKLAALTLLALPVLLFCFALFGKKMRNLATLVHDRSAALSTEIEETLAGIKEIKSYTQESYEQSRFSLTIEQRFDAMMKQNKVNSLFYSIIVTLAILLLVLLIWFGSYEYIHERLLPGDLIAMLFYLGIIIGPLKDCAQKYSKLQESIGASIRIFEILHSLKEKDSPEASAGIEIQGNVKFEKVSFKYPNSDQLVLSEICFEAKPGMTIAIVGKSGAGKTTLINLIPRFFDPESGHIEIDNHAIADFKLSSLRRQVGLLPQETFLFGGTIAENIAYAAPDVNEAKIREAAKAACAHEFIMQTPNQYQTIIGDRGIKLSAGQRQRIAIARLLLKDCRIVILDEATSSLDFESIRALNKAITNLVKERTAFIITHNLPSIQKADLILVMDQGKIVERGTHTQLINKNGLYKNLFSFD